MKDLSHTIEQAQRGEAFTEVPAKVWRASAALKRTGKPGGRGLNQSRWGRS